VDDPDDCCIHDPLEPKGGPNAYDTVKPKNVPIGIANASDTSSEHSDDGINERESHSPDGCVDRDNTHSLKGENEPSTEPELGTGNRDSASQSHADSDDSVVNFEDAFQKWNDQVQHRLRRSSIEQYGVRIRRFARKVLLEQYTLRQIRGKKGAWLICEFLKTEPKGDWRYAISALKDFWSNGLHIDWPEADVKTFVGRLPQTGRGFVPREHFVKPWYSAIEKEPDIYRKLTVLLPAGFGYRADHLYKLKMEDAQIDENGNPDAIVADGKKRGFKTDAWVASYLPSYVRDVLKEFDGKIGERKPDDPLIPYRHSNGRIEKSRPMNKEVFYREWHRFENTWSLPKLVPNAFRHFVCRICESVDLSKSASGYLVGHGTRQGETYRDWYSNLDVEEALEEQRTKLPTGIMGLLITPKIDLTEKFPSQLLDLCSEYLKGEIADIDFASRVGRIRIQIAAEEAKHLEP